MPQATATAEPSARPTLPLLYLDEQMVAVDKPSGLIVHRGWGQDEHTAVDVARAQLGGQILPVHRLDRATSGVLLFARDATSARFLHEQFESGAAEKCYLALVRGQPPDAGTIDHAIPRREGGPRVEAVTEFRTLERYAGFAWVEARPRTGRLHQVRRHLKHLGHPIIGDVNYGRGELNRLFRNDYGLHRLALHAAQLCITQPRSLERLTITAPLPADLATVCLALAASRGQAS
jgi:tRNA pseudouridine65 synthase